MQDKDTLLQDLRSIPATVDEVDYLKRGYHMELFLTPSQVRKLANVMRNHRFYLVFVAGVHLTPDIEIVYQFASYQIPCRIIARAFVDKDGSIPTISDIFHGANWHERETRDMLGVIFSGHPYPQPLLLPEEDADLKPLVKDEKNVKTAHQIRWLPASAAPVAPQTPPEQAVKQ